MSAEISSVHIVRLLASVDRRRVVAALVLAENDLAMQELSAATGLSTREVLGAADRLVSGGLVIDRDGSYSLNEVAFQDVARSEAPAKPPSDHVDQPADIARVLDASFQDGKLITWPAKRSKRLLVLDWLAQQFEIGKRYTDAEANNILRAFGDDTATMRRYLVDEQFLDRGEGSYWRCGGSF